MKEIRSVLRAALYTLCCTVATSTAAREPKDIEAEDMKSKDTGKALLNTTSKIGEGDGMPSAGSRSFVV